MLTVNIGIKGNNLQSNLHDSHYKWLTSYLNYNTITINSTYRGICLGYNHNFYLIIYSLTNFLHFSLCFLSLSHFAAIFLLNFVGAIIVNTKIWYQH